MAGIWRVESSTADGTQGEWIEIGPVPAPILRAAAELPRAEIQVPEQMPQGAMNAPALLFELQQRSSEYRPGAENHVINFTLLPITDVDAQVLTARARAGSAGDPFRWLRQLARVRDGPAARLGRAVHQRHG